MSTYAERIMATDLTQREIDLWRQAVPETPPGWSAIGDRWKSSNGNAYTHNTRGLRVLANTLLEEDGHVWLHVSVSHRGRVPGYWDLKAVKRAFMGPDRKAIEIHAPDTEHVNDYETARHLWCCMTGDVLPDFRRGLGTL